MALAHVCLAAWFVVLSTAASAQTINGTAAYQSASTLPANDTIRVDASRRYVVRVRIRAADRLLFTSDSATPVITGGHPTKVAMTLRPVANTGAGGAQTPPASQNTPNGLEGTAWNAIELYGTAVAPCRARPGRWSSSWVVTIAR
jgi:uncharacterized lipoprotein YbaY